VVVKSGDAAPGTAAGITFGLSTGVTDPSPFIGPSINSSGTVGFIARVTGTGVTANVNDIGVWTKAPGGAVQYLARDGDPISVGVGTATLAAINSFPATSSAGTVGFRGTLALGGSVTASNDTGVWAGTPGAFQNVVRESDTANGTGGATFTSFGDPFLMSGSTVAVTASLVVGGSVTSANDSGMWLGTPGNLQLFVREGATAPGAGGATFSGAPVPTVNAASGTITFRGGLTGTGVTTSNNVGIWAGTSSANIQLLMRSGDTAPTIGTAITAFGGITALADGSVAVNATAATGGSVTTANNQGLFVGTAQANMQLAVRKGDPAPGEPAGVVLNGIGVPIANGNTVGFRTSVTGTGVTTANDGVIFSWSAAGGLTTVAREGNPAPGTGGALFGALGTASPLGFGQLLTIGPNGHVGFYAPLTGAGVNTTNDTGIWVQTDAGLRLVVRKGDQIDLGTPGSPDLVTITNLSLMDNSPSAGVGTGSGYASVGGNFQVTWAATFTDGRSGVFVSVVPEPAAVLGLAAGGLALGAWVRRRVRR
jgi:hypothetical protein